MDRLSIEDSCKYNSVTIFGIVWVTFVTPNDILFRQQIYDLWAYIFEDIVCQIGRTKSKITIIKI